MTNTIVHADGISQFGTAVYPSASRTATPGTMEFELPRDCMGLYLIIDVTVLTATGTLQVELDGVDRVSGKTFKLIQSASLGSTGTTTLAVGPSIPVTSNVSANAIVPDVVRVTATHGNGVALTYSIGMMIS
jgi:hypothetical protein